MRALRHLLAATALALTVAPLWLLGSPEAEASVSIAVTVDGLVQSADAVAVVTPLESHSVWEEGKIRTYTKVRVEESVAGGLATSDEAVVRTLGGVVENIGQTVDGEPVFVIGAQSLLFLRRVRSGNAFEVAARAQGQYPIVVGKSAGGAGAPSKRVIRSGDRGVLLPPRKVVRASKTAVSTEASAKEAASIPKARLAGEALHDRPLDDVARELSDAWRRLHAPARAVAPLTK